MMFLANIWVLIFDDFLLSQHHLDHTYYIFYFITYMKYPLIIFGKMLKKTVTDIRTIFLQDKY